MVMDQRQIKVTIESFVTVSVHIRVGQGVHELLQIVSREAYLIMEHMVVCWPCSPLELTHEHRGLT